MVDCVDECERRDSNLEPWCMCMDEIKMTMRTVHGAQWMWSVECASCGVTRH